MEGKTRLPYPCVLTEVTSIISVRLISLALLLIRLEGHLIFPHLSLPVRATQRGVSAQGYTMSGEASVVG